MDLLLLSDWNGEATRAFGVAFEPLEMQDVSMRSSFLIENGSTVRASWLHGGELPDVDAVIATAQP